MSEYEQRRRRYRYLTWYFGWAIVTSFMAACLAGFSIGLFFVGLEAALFGFLAGRESAHLGADHGS